MRRHRIAADVEIGLVIKVIDSARLEIRGLAYSFTNAPITQALLRARKRGAAGAIGQLK